MPSNKSSTAPIKMQVVVKHKRGLHLRSAAQLAALTAKYDAMVMLSKGRKTVQANSPLEIVALSASPGTKLGITISGNEAQTAATALLDFFNNPEDAL